MGIGYLRLVLFKIRDGKPKLRSQRGLFSPVSVPIDPLNNMPHLGIL